MDWPCWEMGEEPLMPDETIGRRLRRYARSGIAANAVELAMAADAELFAETTIAELRAELEKARTASREWHRAAKAALDGDTHALKCWIAVADGNL
jgi:hypothetical protein